MTDNSVKARLRLALRLLGIVLAAGAAINVFWHLFGGLEWRRSSPWMVGGWFLIGISSLLWGPTNEAGPVRRRVCGVLYNVGWALVVLAVLFDRGVL